MEKVQALHEEVRLKLELTVLLPADRAIFDRRWPLIVAFPARHLIYTAIGPVFWEVTSPQGIDGNIHVQYAWQVERN
jgi:hypothetical protein